MKAILLPLLVLSLVAKAQVNPNYDANLAEELNADDYGMKSYILVILETGTNDSVDPEAKSAAFEGHMSNMGDMVKRNQLVVAGPIGKNDHNYRGIFILNASDKEEAREILKSDPAIAQGYLMANLFDWYGSAALPTYLEASDKIWKINP